MKKLIFIFLSLPLFVFSQTNVTENYTKPYFQGNVKVNDTLGVAGEAIFHDTVNVQKAILYPDGTIGTTAGAMSVDNADSLGGIEAAAYMLLSDTSFVITETALIDTLLKYFDSTAVKVWVNAQGFLIGSDTTSLSNRINLKLNKSDTASLSNRINLKLNSADTISLSNRINLKLNITDTTGISTRVGLNTVHRSSNGTDHTYIDQDLRTTASPQFDTIKTQVVTIGTDTIDGSIDATAFTGNLASSGTPADTIFANVLSGKTISPYYLAQLLTNGDSTITTTDAGAYYTTALWRDTLLENFTATDSTLTLDATGSGYYFINFFASFSYSAITLQSVYFSLFIDDVKNETFEAECTPTLLGISNTSWGAIVWLDGGEVLKIKVKGTGAGSTVTITHGGFGVNRL